jgi:hypothetical protein
VTPGSMYLFDFGCVLIAVQRLMAIDKTSLQLYDEEHASNGLEALDPPSHNESTSHIQQESEQSIDPNTLREPSVTSATSSK